MDKIKPENVERKERRHWHKRVKQNEDDEEVNRLALASEALESNSPSSSYTLTATSGTPQQDMGCFDPLVCADSENCDVRAESFEFDDENLYTQGISDREDSSELNMSAMNASELAEYSEDETSGVPSDEGSSDSSDTIAATCQPECGPELNDLDLTELYALLDEVHNEEKKPDDALAQKLAAWTLKHNAVHSHVDDLLQILQTEGHPHLPAYCKTLLKTPKKIQDQITVVANGAFWYQGILKGMTPFLAKEFSEGQTEVTIDVSVDGMSPYGSVKLSLWPISGSVVGTKDPCLFIIAMWCGSTKDPVDLKGFLKDFVVEAKEMIKGFPWNGRTLKLRIRWYVADAPARAFLKAVLVHNSYGSCERCTSYGQWKGRVIFPVHAVAEPRTDDSFSSRLHQSYHVGESPLEELGTHMITQFPLDGMHMLYLGVMKKLLGMLLNAKKPSIHKISGDKEKELSNLVASYSSFCPSEFSRRPRALSEWKHYKAHEFRRILLYDGVLIYSELPRVVRENFLLFHCAVRILSDNTKAEFYDNAEYLLNKFVEHCGSRDMYGSTFLVYNVHHLIHFANECKQHGPIEEFSAFKYENFIGSLKNLLHAPGRTLPQIIARVLERATHIPEANRQQCPDIVLKGAHSSGPVSNLEGQQFTHLNLKGMVFRLFKNDSCCAMRSNEIVEIKNFVKTMDNQVWIVGKSYNTKEDIYQYPLKSSELGIYKVSRLMPLKTWKLEEVKQKCMRLPLSKDNDKPESFLCIPMLQYTSE